MTPRIQGDGGRLDELKAAAERVTAQVGADGLTPATRADAVALATFVRDLLALDPYGLVVVDGTVYVHSEPVEVRYVRQLAADLLRAAEQAESSASQAVHPGSRPAGKEGK